MKTYNFKQFTNAKGEEILQVFGPGKLAETTEDAISMPSSEKAKLLFSMYISEISECSKEEIKEDYIFFEASIKGEEAENLYNQILKFK